MRIHCFGYGRRRGPVVTLTLALNNLNLTNHETHLHIEFTGLILVLSKPKPGSVDTAEETLRLHVSLRRAFS